MTPASPAAHAQTTGRDAGKDPVLMRLLRSMSLQDKAAQLFVLQVYGKSADTADPADVAANRKLYGVDNAAQIVARYHPGGFIYYANNVDDPVQLAGFSNGIQRAAMAQPHRIPETIATDQEGGIVARVQPPATQSPGSMALAAGRSTGDAGALARITGRELRAIGVNPEVASLMGVDRGRMALGTMAAAGALAGIAGILLTYYLGSIAAETGDRSVTATAGRRASSPATRCSSGRRSRSSGSRASRARGRCSPWRAARRGRRTG